MTFTLDTIDDIRRNPTKEKQLAKNYSDQHYYYIELLQESSKNPDLYHWVIQQQRLVEELRNKHNLMVWIKKILENDTYFVTNWFFPHKISLEYHAIGIKYILYKLEQKQEILRYVSTVLPTIKNSICLWTMRLNLIKQFEDTCLIQS